MRQMRRCVNRYVMKILSSRTVVSLHGTYGYARTSSIVIAKMRESTVVFKKRRSVTYASLTTVALLR